MLKGEKIKYKSEFQVIDKDFKEINIKELLVTQSVENSFNGTLVFETKVPSHIYDFLVDSDVAHRSYKNAKKDIKDHYNTSSHIKMGDAKIDERNILKKTLSSDSLRGLKEKMYDMSFLAKSRKKQDGIDYKKKIVIFFECGTHNEFSSWNGLYMGRKTASSFKYFTVYEHEVEKREFMTGEIKKKVKLFSDTKKKNNHFKEKYSGVDTENGMFKMHDFIEFNEKFKQDDGYSIIDWTQEREDFLELILNNFIDLNNQLSNYLTNINNEKMDSLVSKSSNLKLLNKSPNH